MAEPGFTKLAQARVAVVGLGLMGGSLALAGFTRVNDATGRITDAGDEIPLATLFESMPVAILRATRQAAPAVRKSTAGQPAERVNP